MNKLVVILFTIYYSLFTCAQEIPPVAEQQLENLTDADQAETEDDSYLQQLEQFRKNPINLNHADAPELKELRILSDLQIASLISYRKLLGSLVSIYELQAVPLWDLATIRRLLPFITLGSPVSVKEDLDQRARNGDHSLLLRISQVLEKSKGFDLSILGAKYRGSPQRIFFRYRYVYKDLLQFGLLGDKDAGELFFKGTQNKGFDFYSFHAFARRIGSVQALALGDFTVNMGQGLIQWQSLAFKKSADITGIKRQSPVLRPYNSPGEFNFHRGIGVTIKKGSIEATVFVSFRRLSAHPAADTISRQNFISSFITSGYHRTDNEIANRNNLQQTSFGGNLKYKSQRWHIGINGVCYKFSLPIMKAGDPYNLYALSGDNWHNLSIDYSYTYRNFHFFGETATDKNFNTAFINGALVSVDPSVDLSLLHRSINKKYQAVNANAFTENTYPANESGFYAGLSIRPAAAWRLDVYGDIYKFPWLKYLADAPAYGKDFMIQLTYHPSKQVDMYMRYRNESKQSNLPAAQRDAMTTNYLVQLPRQNWRVQISYKISTDIVLRNRGEMIWYDKKGDNRVEGFLSFIDIVYKPLQDPWSLIVRWQYFETDDYNSRLYAYENDVLYAYSIPVFFDKGIRYYAVCNYDFTKKLSVWLRWSQVFYRGKDIIGSGPDEIYGNKRTEVKLQALYFF